MGEFTKKYWREFITPLLLILFAGCSQVQTAVNPTALNDLTPVEITVDTQTPQTISVISETSVVGGSPPTPVPTANPTAFLRIDSQLNLLSPGFYLVFYDLEQKTLEAFSFQLITTTIADSNEVFQHSTNTKFAMVGEKLVNLLNKTNADIPELESEICEVASISTSGDTIVADCETGEVFVFQAGTEWLRLFPENYHINNPVLSPDDEQLAFCLTDSEDEHRPGLYHVRLDDCINEEQCELRLISSTCEEDLYAWSPDARLLAVAQQHQGIQIIQLITGNRVDLLSPEQTQKIENMAWSPDGRWIAYSTSEVEESKTFSKIHVFNMQGTEPRLFFESDYEINFVGWLNIISPFKPNSHYIVLPSENQYWLKDNPGEESFNLKLFTAGEKIRVLEKSEIVNDQKWWQVRVGEYTGWVEENSLHFQDDWTYGMVSPVFEPGRRLIVKISGNDLRLRVMPSLKGEVKHNLLPGMKLRIVDGPAVVDNYNWWLVEIEGSKIYGWVAEEALWYASD